MMKPRIIIVCGPTASGKSHLAAALAEEANGVVVNADSMQMYEPLRVLTARPTAEEEARVPHALYGVLPGTKACSAGIWLAKAREVIDPLLAEGRVAVVTGGTGLYLKTLLEGISPIPDIHPEIREQARMLFNQIGAHKFHELLKLRDPKAAEKIRASDTQRMIRAYEVVDQTGRSLMEWQEVAPEIPYHASAILPVEIEIDRALLYRRCDERFLAMVEQGAMQEVENLLALRLPAHLPVMKAVGVPELAGVLKGRLSIEEAITKAQQATRNYAKRQGTWLRHQMPQNRRISALSLADPAQTRETAREILKFS